jgi:hypothetical protein
MMEKEHQRQCKKEEHAERMLRMQIELARTGGPSRTSPNFAFNDVPGPSLTFPNGAGGLSFGDSLNGLDSGMNGGNW